MAKAYKLTPVRRLGNLLMRNLARIGAARRRTHVLTVRGRKTGRPHSTPVNLIENEAGRWLVAPYGEVSWVHNARAAGEVSLTRGGHTETFRIAEAGPREAAPVLREYLREIPVVKNYFEAAPDSNLEEFAAEAPRHPVFRLIEG